MEAPASRWLRVGFAPVVMVVMGVTLSVSTASTANAQRVEWSPGDTPEECISAGLLRTRIVRAATAPISEDLVLRLGVHHEAEAATYHVVLEVLFADEVLTTRELAVHALRCQELDDTLVLVSVLMLDAATLRRQQRAPAPDPRRWQLGLSAGVMWRVLPGTQPDGGLDLRWMNARFAVNIRGFVSGEAHATAAEGDFELRALGLDVQGCYRSRPLGPFTLGPCVTASLGQLRGLATGLSLEDRVLRNAHVRTGLGLSASVDAGPWFSVVPSLGFDLALTRTSYRYSQSGVTREVWGAGLVVDHEFVQEHRPFLRRTLLRLGMAAGDVDDGIQEVLLAAVSSAHRFEAGRSPRAWLYGIALNITRSQRRRRVRFGVSWAEPPEISVAPEQERRLESRAARSLIHRALDELPEEQRDVVVLHRLEGWPINVVAEAIGCPVATAHSRLRLGTARLGRVVRGNVVRGRWAAIMALLASALGWPPAAAAATATAVLVLGTWATVATLGDAEEPGDGASRSRPASATVARASALPEPRVAAPAEPEETPPPEPEGTSPPGDALATSTPRPAARNARAVSEPSAGQAPRDEPAPALASEPESPPGAQLREATGGTVLEETQLLGRARTIALSSPEAARALLQRYDARFPRGELRRERDAIAALLGE